MPRFLLLLALALTAGAAHAQYDPYPVPTQGHSCLQVIHLSEAASLERVDVYVDDVLAAEGLLYRTATPCIALRGNEAVVTVTPSGAGLENPVADLTLGGGNLIQDGAYPFDHQVILSGENETLGGASESLAADPIVLMETVSLQQGEGRISVGYVSDVRNVEPHDVRFGSTLLASQLAFGGVSTRYITAAEDVELVLAAGRESSTFLVPASAFAAQSLTLVAVTGDGVLPKEVLLFAGDGTTTLLAANSARSLAALAAFDASVRVASPAPNPFAGTTTLGVELDASASVAVEVFDVQGRRVAALSPRELNAGPHRLAVDVNAGPGIYLYRVTAVAQGASVVRTGRMVSMR